MIELQTISVWSVAYVSVWRPNLYRFGTSSTNHDNIFTVAEVPHWKKESTFTLLMWSLTSESYRFGV